MHDRAAGSGFMIRDCYATLKQQRINLSDEGRRSFKSLIKFLEALATLGIISIEKDANGRVARIVTNGVGIDEALQQQREAHRIAVEKRDRERRLNDETSPTAAAARRRARRERSDEKQREQQARQAAWEATEAAKAARLTDWEASPIYREAADAHGGAIPACIAWPGGEHRDAIGAAPSLWRAHIYMRLVHQKPTGTLVTATLARRVLDDAGVPLVGPNAHVFLAINDYLDNLRARGILARPDGPLSQGWVVATPQG